MHIPQVRPFRLDPSPRRHVRDGPKRHQREDLRLPLVLAGVPLPVLGADLAVAPLQCRSAQSELGVQQIRLRLFLSRKTEPRKGVDPSEVLQLHRLALPELPRRQHGRDHV